MIPGAAALAASAGLGAWASVAAGQGGQLVVGVGILGWVVLGVALLGRWSELVPWGIALLGGQYAASLLLRDGGIDLLSPLYAAALVVTAELVFWGLEAEPGLGGRAVVLRRLVSVLGLALGAAGVGAVLLAVSDGGAGSGVLLQLLGLLAAATTIGFVAWLSWRMRLH